MTIICPECGTPYRLPAGVVPQQKSAAKCKKCGTRMIISPEKQVEDDISHDHLEDQEPTAADNTEAEADRPEADVSPVTAEISDDVSGHKESDDEIFLLFPELKDLQLDRFILAEIFSKDKKCRFIRRKNKLRAKLIHAVAPTLEKILLENEMVLKVAKGSGYYPWEIPYANGIFTLPSNYFAIVCTNFRVLLINVDHRMKKTTRYLFQIFYDEIILVRRGIFLTSLVIQMRNGKILNFTSVGSYSAKDLKNFIILKKQEGNTGLPDRISGWQLCPECYTPLSENVLECSLCKSEFKNPSVACKRSFILPGLGSLYLGYIPLGILEISIYLLTWLFLAALAFLKLPGMVPVWVLVLLTAHSVSGLASLKLGQKGMIVHNTVENVNESVEHAPEDDQRDQ